MAEVTITGKERLMARLLELQQNMPKAALEGITKVATDIRDTAKELCPVDTGSLKKSIRLQGTARPEGMFYKIGVSAGGYITNPKTKRKVDYAGPVEYGTSRTRPQAFMRPAIIKHKDELAKEIRRLIKE